MNSLLSHYGYIVLFLGLTLELLGLPTPGETLMAYCGYLVFLKKLNLTLSILTAFLGTSLGITLSYIIGRTLGYPFFKRYGKYVHLGPEKLEKASDWFERYGNKLLIAAYFIPGIRHITGYFSGISKITYGKFSRNAYIGSFLWTFTFVSIGKMVGPNWEKYHNTVKKYLIVIGIFVTLALLIIYFIRRYRTEIVRGLSNGLSNALRIFHTLGRVKLMVASAAIAFIGLFGLMIGMIQDLLAHEFIQFDSIVTYIIKLIFGSGMNRIMVGFTHITSGYILAVIDLFAIAWIIKKGRTKRLEVIFLLITTLGGGVLGKVLNIMFHRTGPLGSFTAGSLKYAFPSIPAINVITFYGFLAFIIIRHHKRLNAGSAIGLAFVTLALLAGISEVYLDLQYPSDITAGYAFGGMWLSLNIVMLEIYRIMPRLRGESL